MHFEGLKVWYFFVCSTCIMFRFGGFMKGFDVANDVVTNGEIHSRSFQGSVNFAPVL